MLATVDLGLVSIYNRIYEFSGSVTLAGGASTTRTFTAENATSFYESYVSVDRNISIDVEIMGSDEVVLIFMNHSDTQISTSFNVKIGFQGG